MQLHCHCSICMSIVFTANAARPCRELRGAPIQCHTKPYHTMPHPENDTRPQRTQLHTEKHRIREYHTIPYHSSVVSRNLAVLLSSWYLIVIQTRYGPKLMDAETL